MGADAPPLFQEGNMDKTTKLECSIALVEHPGGPGLRIDVSIPWDRLAGLARAIRYWQVRADAVDPTIGEREGK